MATRTDLTADDLRELVNKAAKKDRRIVSFSILFSVIAVAAGVLWLWSEKTVSHKLSSDTFAKLKRTKPPRSRKFFKALV